MFPKQALLEFRLSFLAFQRFLGIFTILREGARLDAKRCSATTGCRFQALIP